MGAQPYTLIIHHTGRLPGVLGAYSVQQLKEVGSIIMGVALARYTHACICTLFIEHVCMIFRQSTRDTRNEQSYAWKLGEVTLQNQRKNRDRRHARVGFVIRLSSRSRGISSLIRLSSEPLTRKAITYNKIVSRPPPACYFGTRILTYYWKFHRPHPLIQGGFGGVVIFLHARSCSKLLNCIPANSSRIIILLIR